MAIWGCGGKTNIDPDSILPGKYWSDFFNSTFRYLLQMTNSHWTLITDPLYHKWTLYAQSKYYIKLLSYSSDSSPNFQKQNHAFGAAYYYTFVEIYGSKYIIQIAIKDKQPSGQFLGKKNRCPIPFHSSSVYEKSGSLIRNGLQHPLWYFTCPTKPVPNEKGVKVIPSLRKLWFSERVLFLRSIQIGHGIDIFSKLTTINHRICLYAPCMEIWPKIPKKVS